MTSNGRVSKTKEMPCRSCSKPMTVGARTRNQPRCFECGIKASVQAIRQMQEKRGPIYERYRAGMARYYDREIKGS